MVAYFYSKVIKQAQLAFAAILLAVCLMGTHWIGFSHSISHATQQNQSELVSGLVAAASATHSSDACHLFDALTLAGFISSGNAIETIRPTRFELANAIEDSLIASQLPLRYQSRAPPSTLL